MKPCYNKGTLIGSASNEASVIPREAAGGTIILTIGNPYMQVNGQARERFTTRTASMKTACTELKPTAAGGKK